MSKRVQKYQVIKLMDEVSKHSHGYIQYHDLRKEDGDWATSTYNLRGNYRSRVYMGSTLREVYNGLVEELQECNYRKSQEYPVVPTP
jgi:hypothetical protein